MPPIDPDDTLGVDPDDRMADMATTTHRSAEAVPIACDAKLYVVRVLLTNAVPMKVTVAAGAGAAVGNRTGPNPRGPT